MIDYYALFGEPRRPSLDLEELKRKFLAASARWHPDRIHDQAGEEKESATGRFMEFNQAYQCLREPTTRTRHLWELESGETPKDVQRIPGDLAELFEAVFTTLRGADEFRERNPAGSSAVAKAIRFQSAMEWVGRLEGIREEIQALESRLKTELESMNSQWLAAPANPPERREKLPLNRLEEIYGALCYLSRWEQKLNEKTAQLAW